MTDAQYAKAIPDPKKRTAISGFLMRKGWEVAFQQVEMKLGISDPEAALEEARKALDAIAKIEGEMDACATKRVASIALRALARLSPDNRKD